MFSSALSPDMAKVDPYNCWDGVVNGAARDEELENILSILDFPMESLEGDGFVEDWDVSKLQFHLGPIPSDVLMGPPMVTQSKVETRPPMVAQSKAETGPPVLLHGQVALLPYRFEETSGSCIRRQNKSTEVQEQGVFQSQSPVSVLENSGSSLAGKGSLIKSNISKRSRSKRARPSGVNPWLLISPLFTISSTSSRNYNARKERRKKLSQPTATKKTIQDCSSMTGNSFLASDYAEWQNAGPPRPAVTKKCSHCEVTKTPQWREGPMGPKTLCNACGVRYRSGRLFPEYRPAASPTFVPSLHSNSHKKVIEMRTKSNQKQVTKIEEPPMSPLLEFIPMSSYFFDPIY